LPFEISPMRKATWLRGLPGPIVCDRLPVQRNMRARYF
jgi:hypothetical protein